MSQPPERLYAAVIEVIQMHEPHPRDVLAVTLYLAGQAAQQCGTNWDALRKPFEAAMKDADISQPDQGVN